MRIAIGGPIASGKSTLVQKLSEELKTKALSEFANDDPVFDTLLSWLYDGLEDVEMLLQVYFLHKHWSALAKEDNDIIIDRHMIEHWLFAQNNIKDKTVRNFYNSLFYNYINDVKKVDLYLILSINWTTFIKRIEKRGRRQEVDNLEKNLEYFRKLNSDYIDKLKAQCLIHGIDYQVIDANGPEEEVLEKALSIIRHREMLNTVETKNKGNSIYEE